MTHTSPQGERMSSVELTTQPSSYKLWQLGVGTNLLMAQVVTGIRLDGEMPITWAPVSDHRKIGDAETRSIDLPCNVADCFKSFVLKNLVEASGQSYDCKEFTRILSGWPREQDLAISSESNTAPDKIQNGIAYYMESPGFEAVTGISYSHAFMGIGPTSGLSVLGPSRQNLGEIVLTDVADLLTVFGGVALLEVEARLKECN